MLDLGQVAGIESSSELLTAVWPAFVGAGTGSSVPNGTCLNGSLAWPPPEADIARIETQLRQRLSEGTTSDLDLPHACSSSALQDHWLRGGMP